jgi:spermidine/putrescine transport system permease protein
MNRHITVTALALIGFAFLYVPLISIIVNAFNADETMIRWGGFTLQWFADALGNVEFLTSLVTSLAIAVAAGVLSVLVAFLGAVGRRDLRSRALAGADDLTVLVRLVLPIVIIVMAIFLTSRLAGLPLGAWLIVGAQTVYSSAYAFLIINARLSQLNASFEDAARDLGARPGVVFWRITFPLVLPSLIVAFLMAFTFSLDDVVGPTFLGGPTVQTLPTMMMSLIRHGATAEVNAIAVLTMLFSLIPLFVALTFTGVKSLSAVGPGRKS